MLSSTPPLLQTVAAKNFSVIPVRHRPISPQPQVFEVASHVCISDAKRRISQKASSRLDVFKKHYSLMNNFLYKQFRDHFDVTFERFFLRTS